MLLGMTESLLELELKSAFTEPSQRWVQPTPPVGEDLRLAKANLFGLSSFCRSKIAGSLQPASQN